jgi:hypothetical protein
MKTKKIEYAALVAFVAFVLFLTLSVIAEPIDQDICKILGGGSGIAFLLFCAMHLSKSRRACR